MVRGELVRRLVLNSICDDFENIDHVILRDVAEGAARFGLTVERSEIVTALASLIEDGLAQAYLLYPDDRDPFSGEVQGTPAMGLSNLPLSDDSWWPSDHTVESR